MNSANLVDIWSRNASRQAKTRGRYKVILLPRRHIYIHKSQAHHCYKELLKNRTNKYIMQYPILLYRETGGSLCYYVLPIPQTYVCRPGASVTWTPTWRVLVSSSTAAQHAFSYPSTYPSVPRSIRVLILLESFEPTYPHLPRTNRPTQTLPAGFQGSYPASWKTFHQFRHS